MSTVFILKYQSVMLNNVQLRESQNQHQSNVELMNQMAGFEKQIILNKQKECTSDDQYMIVNQSLNINDDLLELDE